jgi:hypothetical protein
MSTLVAVDGVVYDLETSRDAPDGVSALVGESPRDEEPVRGASERSSESRMDGPGE